MNNFKKKILSKSNNKYNKCNVMNDTIPSGIFKSQTNKSKSNDIKQHNKTLIIKPEFSNKILIEALNKFDRHNNLPSIKSVEHNYSRLNINIMDITYKVPKMMNNNNHKKITLQKDIYLSTMVMFMLLLN